VAGIVVPRNVAVVDKTEYLDVNCEVVASKGAEVVGNPIVIAEVLNASVDWNG
jgi:hypothetical protein